jgi:predicted RNA binding protein YcfA (HicA-like mRNA interferase family)
LPIKRKAFERHLREHGAEFERHGAKHDVWRGPTGETSTVPRHREIADGTARAICDQLELPRP